MNETTLPPTFQMALAAMKDQAKAVMAADRGALRDAQSRMYALDAQCRRIAKVAVKKGLEIPTITESELAIELCREPR